MEGQEQKIDTQIIDTAIPFNSPPLTIITNKIYKHASICSSIRP